MRSGSGGTPVEHHDPSRSPLVHRCPCARSNLDSENGRVLRADIVLMWLPDTSELIGREIEHVTEQIEGVHPREQRWLSTSGTVSGYESRRAVEIGRRVAQEVREVHGPERRAQNALRRSPVTIKTVLLPFCRSLSAPVST